MRRICWSLSFVVLILAAPHADAADDAVTKAMKLYEKRHYAEAATALRAELPSLEPGKQAAAQMTLGMLYLKNAELHRDLYQAALALNVDYLKKLAAAQGAGRSRFVDLYLGEALLESGKPETAMMYLEKFIAEKSIEPRYKGLARILIGRCFAQQNNKEKADEAWDGYDTADPEIKAALAAAYSASGLKDKDPAALADETVAGLKKTGKQPSMPLLTSIITVYASAGLTDKGLDLLRKADLKAFSYRESLGKTKIINFYDASLLGDLSSLYLKAAIAALEKASGDGKLRATAGYYLGEAYALAGNIDQSMKATASFIAQPAAPQQYRDKAAARQAANQYRKGRQSDATGTWDELSKKQPEDPDVLAEILIACAGLRADCAGIVQKSASSVEFGEGKRLSWLNVSLGKYYLAKKDYVRATSYLEAGRDKGNKNKIESNDPELLVSLAETYYRTKKFSEALEIYFEMSKQFPEVRQIQEALQGIYATEHKSAGDVKIN
jgi:tetratricopeptide (TPR) repeat protein